MLIPAGNGKQLLKQNLSHGCRKIQRLKNVVVGQIQTKPVDSNIPQDSPHRINTVYASHPPAQATTVYVGYYLAALN